MGQRVVWTRVNHSQRHRRQWKRGGFYFQSDRRRWRYRTGSKEIQVSYIWLLQSQRSYFSINVPVIDSFRLITIFDCKIVLKWTGSASDGTEVKGTLTIPEVSHEIICDKLSDFVVSDILPLSRHVTWEWGSWWYLTCLTSINGLLRQTHRLKSMPCSHWLNFVCRKF